MLIQLPRLTNSLRDHFDVDQAYLHRKSILKSLIPNNRPVNSKNALDDSELAKKIVHRWEEASSEVRKLYKQFLGAVVELIGDEVSSEELREVGKMVYDLFGSLGGSEDIPNSDKPGDEIAGDLLDLVGDGAFETIQDLLQHRKELVDAIHRGLFVLKSDKTPSNTQPKMPSYGTQVTIQTESAKQIDKLRRKEEKRHRRGTEQGIEHELSSPNISSLLQASKNKSPFDEIIGTGQASLSVSALPQGTIRKYNKGYEEVRIPPTPTSQMNPGEKLVISTSSCS
ncbi:DNA helicase [Ranunculus cassubicifolius]